MPKGATVPSWTQGPGPAALPGALLHPCGSSCHLPHLCALEKDGKGPFQPLPRLCSVRDEGELTRISAPGIPAQHPGHPQLLWLGIPAVPGWIFHPSSLPWRSARPPLVTRAFLTAGKGLWLRVRVCKAAPASSSSTAGSERVFPIYSLLPGLNPTAPWVSGFWRLALAPGSSWAGAFPLQDRPQSESSADLQKRMRFTYGTPKCAGLG